MSDKPSNDPKSPPKSEKTIAGVAPAAAREKTILGVAPPQVPEKTILGVAPQGGEKTILGVAPQGGEKTILGVAPPPSGTTTSGGPALPTKGEAIHVGEAVDPNRPAGRKQADEIATPKESFAKDDAEHELVSRASDGSLHPAGVPRSGFAKKLVVVVVVGAVGAAGYHERDRLPDYVARVRDLVAPPGTAPATAPAATDPAPALAVQDAGVTSSEPPDARAGSALLADSLPARDAAADASSDAGLRGDAGARDAGTAGDAGPLKDAGASHDAGAGKDAGAKKNDARAVKPAESQHRVRP